MDRERLAQWLDRIFATTDTELDCERFQALLPLFVDLEVAGADPGGRFPAAKAHLAQCPDCAEEYEALGRVARLDARGRLPQVEELLATIEAEPVKERRRVPPVPAT